MTGRSKTSGVLLVSNFLVIAVLAIAAVATAQASDKQEWTSPAHGADDFEALLPSTEGGVTQRRGRVLLEHGGGEGGKHIKHRETAERHAYHNDGIPKTLSYPSRSDGGSESVVMEAKFAMRRRKRRGGMRRGRKRVASKPKKGNSLIFPNDFVIDYNKQNVEVYKNARGEQEIKVDLTHKCGKFTGCGTRIRSKKRYLYGDFSVMAKTPSQTTGGMATTFYLSTRNSDTDRRNLDEIDMEFTKGGDMTQLLTNWWSNTGRPQSRSGSGEEVLHNLPFKPYAGFHKYRIVWTSKKIEWWVDNKMIRQRGYQSSHFPFQPMYLYVSIWYSEDWLGKADWKKGPFKATYKNFRATSPNPLYPGDSRKCLFGQKIC